MPKPSDKMFNVSVTIIPDNAGRVVFELNTRKISCSKTLEYSLNILSIFLHASLHAHKAEMYMAINHDQGKLERKLHATPTAFSMF